MDFFSEYLGDVRVDDGEKYHHENFERAKYIFHFYHTAEKANLPLYLIN
jgi:hypothetical protein